MSGDTPKLIASLALMWFVPALLEDLVLGRGPDDDADKEEWAAWVAKKLGKYPFQSIVLLRDIINGADEYGYSPSAGFDYFEQMSGSVKTVAKLTGDEELDRKDYKSAFMTVGYMAGLPSRQVWTTSEYFYDWLVTGDEVPATPVEGLWRGLVTGKPKE